MHFHNGHLEGRRMTQIFKRPKVCLVIGESIDKKSFWESIAKFWRKAIFFLPKLINFVPSKGKRKNWKSAFGQFQLWKLVLGMVLDALCAIWPLKILYFKHCLLLWYFHCEREHAHPGSFTLQIRIHELRLVPDLSAWKLMQGQPVGAPANWLEANSSFLNFAAAPPEGLGVFPQTLGGFKRVWRVLKGFLGVPKGFDFWASFFCRIYSANPKSCWGGIHWKQTPRTQTCV